MPAHEYATQKDGNHYSVTVIDYGTGPRADRKIVDTAVADLSKKGEVKTRANVEIGIGKPGSQLNIVQPNGLINGQQLMKSIRPRRADTQPKINLRK